MKNNRYSKLKVAFFASFLLNFAFITGFTLKKVQPTQSKKELLVKHDEKKHEISHSHISYNNLCQKNPRFKSMFHEHKNYCQNKCNDLIKIKTKLLFELKQKETNQETIYKLTAQINRLTNELHDKSNKHLLMLKKCLDQKDFVCLLEQMIHALGEQSSNDGCSKKPINERKTK